MDTYTAIRLYTAAGGRLLREDRDVGILAPGAFADVVGFRADLLDCPIDDLPSQQPALTLVGGRPVHDPDGLFGVAARRQVQRAQHQALRGGCEYPGTRGRWLRRDCPEGLLVSVPRGALVAGQPAEPAEPLPAQRHPGRFGAQVDPGQNLPRPLTSALEIGIRCAMSSPGANQRGSRDTADYANGHR